MNKLRIATRKSPLAVWQAEHVKTRLRSAHPELEIELIPLSTQGDRILDVALTKIGGKGLFVKELEIALLERRADMAVHSIKDVPMDLPDGLVLSTVLEREDPTDAMVSNQFESLSDLPRGARVGTSSLRRQCQLRVGRPDLRLFDLRGNVNTRLKRLDDNEFDAIILASAGLKRLGLSGKIRQQLAPEILLPAVGQGAIGVEIREDDTSTAEYLRAIHHEPTACCVRAERTMNRVLQGGCQVPIAGYAILRTGTRVWLRALVGSVDGKTAIREEGEALRKHADALGERLANQLLARGADRLLRPVWGQD